jgi:SAM-dependent methyltransferase
MDKRFVREQFPRSSAYNPEWIVASVSGGACSLWLVEWLTSALDLRPGMRVLDLGCGRAASSVFLHREFGVQVWATDLWFNASETLQRVRDAGVEDGVFPIHAEARSLPFATEFFDVIVSIDWQRLVCPENSAEIIALEADEGRYLGYVRAVGRRRSEAKLDEPILSIPSQYTKAPLLRSEEP